MTAVRSSFVSSVGRSPPDHPSFAPIAGLLFPRSSIHRARPMAAMAGAFSLWKWSPCSRWRPPHASYASDKLDFLKKTVSSHDIVIFSKTYCPYCSRAKSVFKELKKEPFVLELDEREDGPDIQDALSDLVGRRTVPQVFVHGEHLGGSDDTVDAYKSGRLLTLLGIGSKGEI